MTAFILGKITMMNSGYREEDTRVMGRGRREEES